MRSYICVKTLDNTLYNNSFTEGKIYNTVYFPSVNVVIDDNNMYWSDTMIRNLNKTTLILKDIKEHREMQINKIMSNE